MFCPKCGTPCADEASFCHKCGAEIPTENAAKPKAPVAHVSVNDERAAFPEQSGSVSNGPLPPKPQSTAHTLTTVAAVSFLFAMYLNILGPAFSGLEFNTKGRDQIYVLFFSGLIGWWLFKSRGFNKWIGGTLGVALSLAVLIAGVVISARAKNSVEYVLAHTPQIAALQKHQPQEYAQIEKEIAAAKSRGAKTDELQALLNAKVAVLALKVIQSTSDGALLEYGQTKLQMFRDVAAKSTDHCVLLISGKTQEAGPGVAERILASVSEETKAATRKALVRVIKEAVLLETVSDTTVEARFNALYDQVDSKLKSRGTSVYYFGDEKKPADVRCRAGLAIYEEVLNLPPADRSFMLRQLLGSG